MLFGGRALWVLMLGCCSISASVASDCQDQRDTVSCARWRDVYTGCVLYRGYMTTVCNKTCGFCTVATSGPTGIPDPTTPPTTTIPQLPAQSVNCTIVSDVLRLCSQFSCSDQRVIQLCPAKCNTCKAGTRPELASTLPPTTGSHDTDSTAGPIDSEAGSNDADTTTHSNTEAVGSSLVVAISALVVVMFMAIVALVVIFRPTQKRTGQEGSSSSYVSEQHDQSWRQQFGFLDDLGRQNSLKRKIIEELTEGSDLETARHSHGHASHWEQRRMLTARLDPGTVFEDDQLWPDTISVSQAHAADVSFAASNVQTRHGNGNATDAQESGRVHVRTAASAPSNISSPLSSVSWGPGETDGSTIPASSTSGSSVYGTAPEADAVLYAEAAVRSDETKSSDSSASTVHGIISKLNGLGVDSDHVYSQCGDYSTLPSNPKKKGGTRV